jgi:hypothetical protein
MNEIKTQFTEAKTDESELEEIIEEFDLDAALIAEFNAISKEFNTLKIDYQTLLRTRHLGES